MSRTEKIATRAMFFAILELLESRRIRADAPLRPSFM